MPSPYVKVNSDIPGGYMQATIVRDGDSFVKVTANLNGPEIGKYRRPVPRPMYDLCERDLVASGFPETERPQRLRPTVPKVAIGRGVGNDIETIETKVYQLHDVPPKVRTYLESCHQAIEFIRQAPLRVIQGQAHASKQNFAAREPLSFTIHLKNIGTESATVSNPLGDADDAPLVSLSIASLQPDAPPETLVIKRTELSAINPADQQPLASEASSFQLLADDQLLIRLNKAVYIKPGQYRAIISVHFTDSQANDMARVAGSLTMQTETFSVAP